MIEVRFEGLDPRECGEHRTLGGRAWCHDCQEYCDPIGPCKGCELPGLRAELAAHQAAIATLLRMCQTRTVSTHGKRALYVESVHTAVSAVAPGE